MVGIILLSTSLILSTLAAGKVGAVRQTTYSVIPKAQPVHSTGIIVIYARSQIECCVECKKSELCVGAIFTHGIHKSCNLLSSYSSEEERSEDKCFIKMDPGLSYREYGPLMQLNRDPWIKENVFVEDPVSVSGTLIAVRYYAARAGTFYLGGWRTYSSGSAIIDLAWLIKVECSSPGLNMQTVTRTEIMADDYLAISADSSASAGVVYYENVGGSPVNVASSDPRIQKVCIRQRRVDEPVVSIDSTNCYANKAMALELIII